MKVLVVSKNKELVELLSQHEVAGQPLQYILCKTLDDVKEVLGDAVVAVMLDGDGEQDNVSSLLFEQKLHVPLVVVGGADVTGDFFREELDVRVFEKPLHLQELVEMLVEAAKRHALMGQQVELGSWEVLYSSNQLKKSDKTVSLTDKEMAIMHALIAARPGGVDKEALLHAIWGFSQDIDTHTLETHIYRLRQKLGEESVIISTGGGYGLGV